VILPRTKAVRESPWHECRGKKAANSSQQFRNPVIPVELLAGFLERSQYALFLLFLNLIRYDLYPPSVNWFQVHLLVGISASYSKITQGYAIIFLFWVRASLLFLPPLERTKKNPKTQNQTKPPSSHQALTQPIAAHAVASLSVPVKTRET